jgi:hypothetical protein
MTNAELIAELLKWPPDKEVKFIEEHIVEWNEDYTPVFQVIMRHILTRCFFQIII